MITILSFGDIIGKPGRKTLLKVLESAIETHKPEIVTINGENVAGGFGITHKLFKQLTDQPIDYITTGNHWADKREIYKFMEIEPRITIPANMGNVSDENLGLSLLESKNGIPFAIMNFVGRAFMHPDNRNPFATADRLIDKIPNGVKVRIVDMHAEATSEKQGIGVHLAGEVSLVFGTHSHVPTADERILQDHTGYITDIGMTGAYDSIIGMKKEQALKRLITGEKSKLEPAKKDCWACYITADIDPETGKCHTITRHRVQIDDELPN